MSSSSIKSEPEEPWVLKGDLCRCCLSEGSYKDMNDQNDDMELYADILKECLNITLTAVDNIKSSMKICDECITRLKDANSFRAMVMDCDKRLVDLCSRNLVIESIEIDETDVEEPKSEPDCDNVSVVSGARVPELLDPELPELPGFPEDDSDGFSWPDPDSDSREVDVLDLFEEPKKVTTKDFKEMTKREKTIEKALKRAAALKKNNIKTSRALRNVHYGEASTRGHTCLMCVGVYGEELAIQKHVEWKHMSEVPAEHSSIAFFSQVDPHLKCVKCVRSFPDVETARKHKLEVHSTDETTVCEMCGKMFASQSSYLAHMGSYHKIGKKFKCRHCDYVTYGNRSKLKEHMVSHSSQRALECKYCKKTFKKKTRLTLHERVHTSENMKKCPYCDLSFVQRRSLKYHCMKHHPGQPI